MTLIKTSEAPWATSAQTLAQSLDVDPAQGLSEQDVTQKLDQWGYNQLREHQKRSLWQIFIAQLKSLIILLLAAAAIVSFWYGEILEGWAIMVVILINTSIGFFTELQAVRSMEALYTLGTVQTRVRRGGQLMEVDARMLVPGDIVIIEGGDVITADMRILQSSKLQVNESALTGESLPVGKSTEPVAEETILAERSSMLYKGTAITRGSGEAVVVATGTETELGHISLMVESAKEEQTPLEERLDRLGYRLIAFTLVIALFVTISGILSGKEIFLMIETGIALAVAAIPEGLPIVATIALANGMRIMAEKNAIVTRLSAVETLGTTNIIFTDKTGTLTENRMTVSKVLVPDQSYQTADQQSLATDSVATMALEAGALCNNASLFSGLNGQGSGDPLEIALLEAAQNAGIDIAQLREQYPEIQEEAFDPEIKMMATWHRINEQQNRIVVKGAPEAVLPLCTSIYAQEGTRAITNQDQRNWESTNAELAADGLRIIALAFRDTIGTNHHPYEELTFLGLMALEDPPRDDVKPAISNCKKAGIRVIMVTGDQERTARYIGRAVGLTDEEEPDIIHGNQLRDDVALEEQSVGIDRILTTGIFSRISPKQKLDLIDLFQKQGNIVAMTGDGVNDAPALKKADIGIAMGQRGTQVAKEAADMVLLDDAFSTIVAAIEQGRVIFGNIRRFIYYLLSCNVSEILIVGLATLIGAPLPVLPLQILFLNLVTDVFPALALGVGKAEDGIMQQPPRRESESILTPRHWIGIIGYGLLISAAVLGALFWGLRLETLDTTEAVTFSFLTLAFAQLWHVFNMRAPNSSLLNNTIIFNPYVWGAIIICVILIISATYIPYIATILKIVPPDLTGWSIILGMSLIPLIVGQLILYFRK